MTHLRAFLTEIRRSGLTINVKKFSFAKLKVKFISIVIQIRMSKNSRLSLRRPITKRDVRRMLGCFSYFRANIPNAANLTHALSNLVAKDIPVRVECNKVEEDAFHQLKQAL